MSSHLTDEVAKQLASGKPTVSRAIADVMAAMPGIGKTSQAAQSQGGYAYRGIEAITQHVQPLFAEHGIVFAPRVESWEVRDITVANKPWTDTLLMVAYDVYGPAGDSITVGPILAIGRDNSDKGANKAMTQAFKYALLQTLCISDSKDDGDGQTHEADVPAPPPRLPLHPNKVQSLRDRCEAIGATVSEVVSAATEGRTTDPAEVFADEADAVKAVLDALTPAPAAGGVPEPEGATTDG